MTGHLPGEWKLADHPEHGRVLVINVSGDIAVYATPFKVIGIRTYISPVSDLTFVDTDSQTTEET